MEEKLVVISVDNEKLSKCGTLENEFGWLKESGIYLKQILDWIPCCELLPDSHKLYDITTKNEAGMHCDSAIYNPNQKTWFWDSDELKPVNIEVLAWAEKREAYHPQNLKSDEDTRAAIEAGFRNVVEDPFSKAAIEARFRDAEKYQWDKQDFYMYLLADGIDVNLVRKYMGDETADIMLNYCVYRGLI